MYSGASLFPPSFSSWHLITNHSVFFPSLIMTSHQWAISVGKQQRKMVGSCTIFLFRLVDLFLYYYYFYDLCRETWTICSRPPQSQCLPKFSLSFVACFMGEAGKKEDTDAAAFLLSLISSLGIQTQMCCVSQLFLSFFSPCTTSYVL